VHRTIEDSYSELSLCQSIVALLHKHRITYRVYLGGELFPVKFK